MRWAKALLEERGITGGTTVRMSHLWNRKREICLKLIMRVGPFNLLTLVQGSAIRYDLRRVYWTSSRRYLIQWKERCERETRIWCTATVTTDAKFWIMRKHVEKKFHCISYLSILHFTYIHRMCIITNSISLTNDVLQKCFLWNASSDSVYRELQRW